MERIVIDPEICNGKPTVAGTRVTVHTVLDYLGAGDSFEDILEGYPFLTREDILACIRFSSQMLDHRYVLKEVV